MEQGIDKAISRVLRKLSAVRATLNDQERQILDGLLMGESAEVVAHARAVGHGAETRKPEPEVRAHVRKPFMGGEAHAPAPDEVHAHARTPGVAPEAHTPAPAEVHAHARTPGMGADTRRPSPDEVRPRLRPVELDQETGEYRMP